MRYLGPDGAGELEIGRRRHPHGRPDLALRLIVDRSAADDADEIDEARAGVEARDLDAVLLAQAALQHLIARHADADEEIFADRLAAGLEHLEAEAQPIVERTAIADRCACSLPATRIAR